MHPEYKKKWIESLRSGEYKQGKGALKFENEYCCLGVLCDLFTQEDPITYKWISNSFHGSWGDHRDEILPADIAVKSGLKDFNPTITAYIGSEEFEKSLAELNDDHGFTFEMIADLIEEQL